MFAGSKTAADHMHFWHAAQCLLAMISGSERAWMVSLSCCGVRSRGDTSPAASSQGWKVPLIFLISALLVATCTMHLLLPQRCRKHLHV